MRQIHIGLLVAALSFAVGSPSRAADAETKAALELAGTRQGLCLHLGCGSERSADLIAGLAAESHMLVHGLAIDDAALGRARAAIAARNLGGRAMAEKVALNPLPYLPDLANVIVVEDMAALNKAGVTREEIVRVLAPGGALCTLENGKWNKFVKPRPAGMDEWTHPRHGADANLVSTDKVAQFPLGFRWLDGMPMNINRWASCRGWVTAGGRIFMLTANELENLNAPQKSHYLEAHDAFNGLPLWKINCETTDDGGALYWVNSGALATDGKLVFVAAKDKAIGVEAATGKIAVQYNTKFPTARLLTLDNVLVTSNWENREASKSPSDAGSVWMTWVAKAAKGTVEAFDGATGKSKWATDYPAESIAAADGVVYLLVQAGNPPTSRDVVALDLQTGKVKWRVSHSRFGDEPDLQLNAAAKGCVVIAKRGDASGLGAPKKPAGESPREKAIFVLSAEDGSTMWQIKPATGVWTPVVDGQLWHGSKKHDLKTGEIKGNIGWGLGEQYCTPQSVVNNYLLRPRGGQFVELPHDDQASKGFSFQGARGACIEGFAAANGLFYTAQNNCRCTPGQAYGFVAAGPVGTLPTADDFQKERPLEKGPAYGSVEKTAANGVDWPTFRHDGERTAATGGKAPAQLTPTWKTPVLKADGGPLDGAWQARLISRLSAPVAAGGKIFVSATNEGRVIALNESTGKEAWSAQLGGRIDSPPTIHGGLALVGCHDGWVYALSTNDGQLAWRVRVAPMERRMVAFGQVESTWPVVGTVLVHDGIAYANAGRTSEADGGIAVVALDASTGKQLWAKAISTGQRQNDMLAVRDGAIGWWHVRLDPKTGATIPANAFVFDDSQGGMLDGVWTLIGERRSGRAFRVGRAVASIMAWNNALVTGPTFAVSVEKSRLPAIPAGTKEAPKVDLKPEEFNWKPALPNGAQAEAVVMTSSSVLYAGRVKGAKATGFLSLVSLTDGSKIATVALDDVPTCDGAAVSGGKVFVSLRNGTVACFGK